MRRARAPRRRKAGGNPADRETLSRCWNGKTEVIAQFGGGPNGAAIGPDGTVYVRNSGGATFVERNGVTIPGSASPDGSKIIEVYFGSLRYDLGWGYVVGRSYFSQEDPAGAYGDAWYERIVRFEIEPLLEKYFPDKVSELVDGLLG